MPKQKTNWIVDAVLFIGFQLSFFLDLTGLAWHQWLGVFIGTLALYHLLLHWKWVSAVTKRFLSKTSRQSRLYYLLDWTILLIFLMIGLTGVVISTWLDLELANYIFWKDLHVYTSIASLVLILIKIAAHWRWIVKTARNYFGLWNQPAPVHSQAPVRPGAQTPLLNRREFLQLMGIAGVASLISAANLVDIGQAAGQGILKQQTKPPLLPDTDSVNSDLREASCQVICDQGCIYPGQCRRYIDQNNNGICDLTECSGTGSPEITEPALNTPEEGTPSLPDLDPGAQIQDQGTAGCVLLCPKACQYPGECRDYTDLNNNGLCDYGECLESNTEMEIPSSSHGGGGGRQRRGKN